MMKRKRERRQVKPQKGGKSLRKKWVIGGSVILAILLLVLVMIIKTGGSAGKSGEDVQYAESVAELTGINLGAQNNFTGVVESQSTLNITLDSEQKVREIFVEKGQSVKKGDPLFEYDTDELSMNLEQTRLELEKTENSIASLKSQINELSKEKKKASSDEKLSYTTQIQELQMNVKEEEYDQKVKALEIKQAEEKLENATVCSTINGVVQEVNEMQGEAEEYSGEEEPFISVLSTGKYRIRGKVSEQNMSSLSEGTKVLVRSRVDESLTWTGTVDMIDTEKPLSQNTEESESGEQATKYPFYVTLDSSDGLMMGQHVYVEPSAGENGQGGGMWLMSSYLILPDDVKEGSTAHVWAVDRKDCLEKREVKIGGYDEEMDSYEILDGLQPADYIVWPSEDCKEGVRVNKNAAEETDGTGDEEVQ